MIYRPATPGPCKNELVKIMPTALLVGLSFVTSGCVWNSPSGNPTVYGCSGGEVAQTSAELTRRLEQAQPGDVIALTQRRYVGRFAISARGTTKAPIVLCGETGSILEGPSITTGYTLHLDGAAWITVQDLSITGGQKGLVLDSSDHVTLSELSISDTGQEAVHLRRHSSDNLVSRVSISTTGLSSPEFGEGIYVGSASANWCKLTECEPDRSDRNTIESSKIANTTAEPIDVKEGTTAGVIRDNNLSSTAGRKRSAIDLKGNAWRVTDNRISVLDAPAVSIYSLAPGWGVENIIGANHFELASNGEAVHVPDGNVARQTQVACEQITITTGRISDASC